MATKIKVVRTITYKAYAIEDVSTIKLDAHTGNYFTKSDCHYYCEKDCLDAIKASAKDGMIYAIYQISTIEDSDIKDKLIEVIEYKDGEIKIY